MLAAGTVPKSIYIKPLLYTRKVKGSIPDEVIGFFN
jgi:hypothetical protein